MPSTKSPRKGSLQFWPRKRAQKFLPRVNWNAIDNSTKPLKGFICYKAGMTSVLVKDDTEHSMIKGKKKVIAGTILECPAMKILSVRFYKHGKVANESLAEDLAKELKKKIKIPKVAKKLDSLKTEEYDDLRIIVYSLVKKSGLKKTPDIIEVGINGTYAEKLEYVKAKLGKEISVLDYFEVGEPVDLRGLTKGKGLQGPVRRFGIQLKNQKSEKGRRRPGSLGPWHPARVIFRVPMAGQLGMFTRVIYNNVVIALGKDGEKLKNIKNYGDVKSEYVIVQGSVQGPAKRQLLLTKALRPTRKQLKKKYELMEILR